jgi:REase_DpnII-MboI
MKVSELKRQLEEFRRDLITYRKLWNSSLESGVPDYSVENIEELQQQASSLFRQLGRLRLYMEALHSSWTLRHGGAGISWNILDVALGNESVAQAKGPSLNALVDALQLVLGRLDDYNPDEEFRMGALVSVNSDIELAERICSRAAKSARILMSRRKGKENFAIADEYDVQDLIHFLFRGYFKYPVVENPLPKPAGAASARADLSIEDLGLLVEAKFVRAEKDQRRIEKELAEDLVFYATWAPLKYLFFVVYNSADLQNAELLDKFSKPQTINEKHFTVRVINV